MRGSAQTVKPFSLDWKGLKLFAEGAIFHNTYYVIIYN